MRKKILINCSNHPSSKWSSEQRQGWDEIIDVPFPNVEPDWDTNDLIYQETIRNLWKNIVDIVRTREEVVYLYIAGEYTLCYEVVMMATKWMIPIAIPTTKREVVETKNEDGSTTKTSKFEFVRWRIIG